MSDTTLAYEQYLAAERRLFLAFSEANDDPHGEGNRIAELGLTMKIANARAKCRENPSDNQAWSDLYKLEWERLNS